MPPVEIKKFDALIYNKLFFIPPVKNRQETYEKLQMSKNNDCLTENLSAKLSQSYWCRFIKTNKYKHTSTNEFCTKNNGANVFLQLKSIKNYSYLFCRFINCKASH